MTASRIAVRALQIAGATVIYLVCFIIASTITVAPLLTSQPSAEEAQAAARVVPLVALLNTLVFAYVILRSRWNGWRLAAAVFAVFYGTYTLLPQLEILAFPQVASRLPPGMLRAFFLMGVLVAGPFALLAVLILGKWKRDPSVHGPNTRLIMPVTQWLWKLAAIAVLYVVLYFTFGYYLAWRNPAVPAYYGRTDPGTFWAQMSNVLRDTPWLPLFQAFRAMLWTIIALPVIRMMKGNAWEAGLAVALVFSVVMNSGLLVPNPYMPEAVRMAHLVETASSNFVFGCATVWLLHLRHRSASDLFKATSASG